MYKVKHNEILNLEKLRIKMKLSARKPKKNNWTFNLIKYHWQNNTHDSV